MRTGKERKGRKRFRIGKKRRDERRSGKSRKRIRKGRGEEE
jgi:hypothetical protein